VAFSVLSKVQLPAGAFGEVCVVWGVVKGAVSILQCAGQGSLPEPFLSLPGHRKFKFQAYDFSWGSIQWYAPEKAPILTFS